MKELALYLLLVQGGNASPSAADVKAAGDKVGISTEVEAIEAVIASVAGKVRTAEPDAR